MKKKTELLELKVRLTPPQKAWLEKRAAERYGENVSFTLRKLIDELIKIDYKGLQ